MWKRKRVCERERERHRESFEKSLRNLPCLAWPFFSVIYLILCLLLMLCSTSFYSVLWHPFLSSLPSSRFLFSSGIRVFWSRSPGGGVVYVCGRHRHWRERLMLNEMTVFGNDRKICLARAPGWLCSAWPGEYSELCFQISTERNPAWEEPESFSSSKPRGLMEGHAVKKTAVMVNRVWGQNWEKTYMSRWIQSQGRPLANHLRVSLWQAEDASPFQHLFNRNEIYKVGGY